MNDFIGTVQNIWHQHLQSAELLLSTDNIALALVATLLGISIGMLPGLTATMGIALLTTLTYQFPPQTALIVLLCVYVGAIYGGSRSAILLNIPGTPANAATTLDGHPLAKSGQAATAMSTATTASFLGTLIGLCMLALLAPYLADYALEFQTHEYLWLAVFGILISGRLTASEDPLKGWLAGVLGLSVAMVGMEKLYMTERFTFGIVELQGGINLIPAMVGAFGFSEVLSVMSRPRAEISAGSYKLKDALPDFKKLTFYRCTVCRSGIIGTAMGIVPGVGEDIGAWASYAAARRASKEKKMFGKGSLEGLIAAETGNSAAAPGALIPVLTLGLPGSAPSAVLLAAMILHGVKPGPMIMIENPGFISQIVIMMLMASAAMLVLGVVITPFLIRILSVPRERLMPVVFALCVIGSFAIQQSVFDIWIMLVFGVAGFYLRKLGLPMAPLILGIVLGDILDKSFRRSWVIHDGDFTFYFSRPICVVLIILCLITLIVGFKPVSRFLQSTGKRLLSR